MGEKTRIPLSPSLESRDGSITKDAQIVNAFAETKPAPRTYMRPALRSWTAGSGFGQALITNGEKLFSVISGVMTPINNSNYVLTAIRDPVGTALWGYDPSLGLTNANGAYIYPTTFGGSAFLSFIVSNLTPPPVFSVWIDGVHAQNFFAQIKVGGYTFLSSAAGFATTGGHTEWSWSNSAPFTTGRYPVRIT